jgi:hypothetical protein
MARKKYKRDIIVPYQHTNNWEDMPSWLLTKRKVKQPNVYFRALIKHNLPVPEAYEANEKDLEFIKNTNKISEATDSMAPLLNT